MRPRLPANRSCAGSHSHSGVPRGPPPQYLEYAEISPHDLAFFFFTGPAFRDSLGEGFGVARSSLLLRAKGLMGEASALVGRTAFPSIDGRDHLLVCVARFLLNLKCLPVVYPVCDFTA